jgi:GTP cyclohydrolase IA
MDSTRFGENGMNKLAKINGGDFRSESAIKSAGGIARRSREQVEQAVSTLIRMVGRRSRARGLVATPARVVRADEEWFSGYDEDPEELLQRTFEEVARRDGADARHSLRVPL